MKVNTDRTIRLFLCGDVMTGRGIDQVMPHPCDPELHEPYVRDARRYVELAERASGKIRWPIDPDSIWGDALEVLRQERVDARVINLETSITTSDDHWPHKAIHYRMQPLNIGCLTSANFDCCCLANNHVLDWGYRGLAETLKVCDEAGLAHPGAGRNIEEAASPATLDLAETGGGAGDQSPAGARVLVFSVGSTTSGIPCEWAATKDNPGVSLLTDLSDASARCLAEQVRSVKRPGDVTVVSIHWGGNWGYHVPREQIDFARRLIDEDIDVVHGHSSHHAKAIEVYHERLILYGCGDFMDDYEGIGGHEEFRNDLKVMYLPRIDAREGRLVELRLVPMQIKQFQLRRAAAADAQWLCDMLSREGRAFGTRAQVERDNSIAVRWR